MSVTDINKEKLNAIRNKLAKSQGFQFSENLKSVFDLNGHRQAESMPNNNVEQNDPMEEDLPDLTPLLDSISILSGSSSQIQTQLKLETLENLVNLPQSQLKIAISSIDMASWADEITADLLKEISKSENIPNANAAYLVYAATYSKITALKSNVPRILMNSIQQLTKDEGKCVIDGLIVPLLFQSGLSKPQCEVINKSTTELNPSQRLFLLKTILSDGESYFATNTDIKLISNDNRNYLRPWNDNVFQLISTILSTQPLVNFDRTHLFDLVQPLQTIVQSNPKDKGSMQLLLLLTSKYAQAIIEFSCIDLIEEICQLSTMFLKRSVLGQLTSIKKKMLV
ncbi:hypothetical protein INT46_003214 [Mucor plumbeus]|uniref:Fanconi Anaemia group E protein C-terminal domain-containing protein n=1 Tax=Mucor plumbeus TaxID=97098 RepID=A0A8H7QT43_9FUNG|nr:hypothetical protein INT46_003214 [Mucor plumbeus]